MSSEIDKIINSTVASFKASDIHLSEYQIILVKLRLMNDISEDKFKELALEYAKRGE